MKHAATREDLSERGVVTYVGLMFAMLIAASAWTTLGTGDAILAKLRSQELADAAVYSSAVTNAQGMNFVATLNVAMLALTGTYVAGQKVVNVLDTAIYVNPNTNGGAWAGSLKGEQKSDGWYVTKNWGRPGAGSFPVSNCAANHSCNDDDQRATCEYLDNHHDYRPWDHSESFCNVAHSIENARWVMAGGGDGDAMGKMGLEGFKAIVVGKSFSEIARMQQSIASTQGSLGDYLGSTMKRQGQDREGQTGILDGSTAAHVVSVCTKGGGNYQSTAAMQLSSNIDGSSLFAGQLPVTPHKAADLCPYLGQGNGNGDDRVGEVANRRANADATRGGAIVGVAMGRGWQCGNGDVWNHDPASPTKLNGPMLMAGGPAPAAPGAERGLQNGGVGFQSVSMITSKMPDGRASLAVKPFGWFGGLGQQSGAAPAGAAANAAGNYRAQGEFYLHCTDGGPWDGSTCNGSNLAMFRLQWRARLTPLPPTSPALTATGLGAGGTPGAQQDTPPADTLKGGVTPPPAPPHT